MTWRTKVNLVLLAVIAVLAAFLLLTGGEQIPVPTPTVSAIDQDSIETITIIRTGETDIRFSRINGNWQMLAPLPASANATRIKAMLSVPRARSYAQLPVADQALERFDLKDPAVILRLDNHEFRFGGSNPLEGRRYLLFAETIHLIDDGLYQQLQQPPEFFMESAWDVQ